MDQHHIYRHSQIDKNIKYETYLKRITYQKKGRKYICKTCSVHMQPTGGYTKNNKMTGKSNIKYNPIQ